jgi:hypothetical protein
MRRSIDPWWVFFPAELRSRATISARSLSPAVSGSITATWVPGPSGPGENDGNPIRSLESLGKSQEKCDHIHNIFFFDCEPFVWQNWQNTWNLDGIFLSMENTKARLVWVVWTATLLLKHNATATGMENYSHITVAKLTLLCGMMGNDGISLWSHAIKWRKFDQQTSVSQAIRIFAHQLMVLDIIKWDLYIYYIVPK